MSKRKRIILHIGFHKTGSSALQVFFSKAAEELAVAGVDYPCPEPVSDLRTGFAVGNLPTLILRSTGNSFFDHGRSKDFQDHFTDEIAEKISRVFDASPFDTILISGELFPLIAEARLRNFLVQLAPRHDPELLCLVRDPFDFMLSMWKQQVRTQLYMQGFEEFFDDVLAGRQQASMLSRFDAMADLGMPMTVLRYESLGKDIAGGVLRALRLAEPDLLAFERPGPGVNASISASRAALAIALLQETNDPDLTDVVMKTLAAKFPEQAAPEPYDKRLHARLLDHFGPTIERINAYLPPDDALATEIRVQDARPLEVREADRNLARDILADLALRSSARTAEDLHPALPPDFDPAVYLLRNPGLVAAGVDAVSHFLTAGRLENRPWRSRRESFGRSAVAEQDNSDGLGNTR